MYPATLADLQTRVSQFDLLAARSDAELSQSLDLAVFHLRASVERDAETGSPPRDVTELGRQLDERLRRLSIACARGVGDMTFEAFEGLGDAPDPGEILDADDDE